MRRQKHQAHPRRFKAPVIFAACLQCYRMLTPGCLTSKPQGAFVVCQRAQRRRLPQKAKSDNLEVAVGPASGYEHTCTLVYLHGYCRCGSEYLPKGPLAFCMPWVAGGDQARGLRAVLPTAQFLEQPWGENSTSWYGYASPNHNRVGDPQSLAETRKRLDALVRQEVSRLGGRQVFLGGASQGCTMALDVYIRLASELELGGFVGSVGFVPTDSKGFSGSNRALRKLLADKEQAARPVWLQCAMDDFTAVPWRSVVEPSLRHASRLPGLCLRQVLGRGHGIEEWEAHLVNDLLRAYAPFAYGPDGKRVLVAARLASKSRVGLLNDTAAAVRSALELQQECSEDQLSHCADAVASLVSLDGLGEFLVDALEHGVASPKPERLSRLGWSSAANALLSTKVTGGGAVELGGGSGAGFQVICEDRGIATLGGGGGGGAFGWIEDHLGSLGALDTLGSFLCARPVAKNETVGGGAGGGMQLFFPANVTGRPWEADHWISWGSGGGHGCGSCKAGDTFCEDSPLRITCGAKMDDNGAVDRAAGLQALRNWRVGVLRACYDAGKLAVIGGGGGGAGGARCCAAVPRLKYGFGFRAELRPQKASESTWFRSGLPKGKQCCPDLSGWNSTTMAVGLGSQLAQGFARRLSVAFGGLGGGALPDELAPLVDPFARENTGHQPPGHANRRPLLEELMKQHDKRLGVDRSELIARAANTETCALPAWLNMTQLTALNSRPGGDVSPDGSGTKEPEVALKYIFKFNPLQRYLADGASRCGGWSDWCCVCHAAQWQIACLPEVEKNAVDWFLTEDCCESKMRKDTSSPGYVADATPLRDSVVMWRPNVGWIELPRSMNVSDSYHWMGEYGDDGLCPTVAFPEMWIRAKAADADANVPLMLGNVEHANAWSNTRVVATSAAVLGYMAQAALVIILLFMARLVKGGPRREQERYIQMTEV